MFPLPPIPRLLIARVCILSNTITSDCRMFGSNRFYIMCKEKLDSKIMIFISVLPLKSRPQCLLTMLTHSIQLLGNLVFSDLYRCLN